MPERSKHLEKRTETSLYPLPLANDTSFTEWYEKFREHSSAFHDLPGATVVQLKV